MYSTLAGTRDAAAGISTDAVLLLGAPTLPHLASPLTTVEEASGGGAPATAQSKAKRDVSKLAENDVVGTR
jgi:hypothetical protein